MGSVYIIQGALQVLLERTALVYMMAKQEAFVEGRFTCMPYVVLYKVCSQPAFIRILESRVVQYKLCARFVSVLMGPMPDSHDVQAMHETIEIHAYSGSMTSSSCKQAVLRPLPSCAWPPDAFTNLLEAVVCCRDRC